MTADDAWFEGIDPGDDDAVAERIRDGRADTPRDWPGRAVEGGAVADEETYYDRLREATIGAAEAAIEQAQRADDRQLAHAVRAMDDCTQAANEIAERVAEWGGSRLDESGTGIDYARTVAERDPEDGGERRLVELARRAVDLHDEAGALRSFIERTAPTVAPNLAALGGPILAARLIALAGDLESLAKLPSSTVQVLGAEDALFAHLRSGSAPPKHGVIFTHEYVNGTSPEHRGSAARALAGKLTIAARIDHYSGDYRPSLEADLDERIERIRARDNGGDGA